MTGDDLAHSLEQWGVDATEATRERIRQSYEHLDPYQDAGQTLTRLSESGHTVTVLSNGTPEMLETQNPAVYENAADRTDSDIGDCRLVSGNAWDIAGAASAGMETAWVNRENDPFERLHVEPSVEVAGLTGVADHLS